VRMFYHRGLRKRLRTRAPGPAAADQPG
jgi:hypothetical protein